MDIIKAHKLVEELLSKTWKVNGNEHILKNRFWVFGGYTKSVRTFGTCKCSRKVIVLSRKLTELRTNDEVEQTILHEIAHAIDFEIRGTSNHDYHWKSIARQIGYTGGTTTKLNTEIILQTKKWIAVCETHGILGGFTRMPTRGKICKKCKKQVLVVPRDSPIVAEWKNK